MISIFLLAQLAIVQDSLYSSPALRAFVEMASVRNRTVPSALLSYRAVVESEIAIVARRADGVESTMSTEQVRNDVRWRRTGAVEQRIVGHRLQSLGLQLSSLSWLRQAWLVPTLYGNRLSLLLGRDTARASLRRSQQRAMTAVHPLAMDRDRVYRFRGGDTTLTITTGGRAIPLVRVRVEPRDDAPPRTLAFHGDLDLDATRFQLVRMRGHFVRIGPRPSLAERLVTASGLNSVAFVEVENAEFDGQFWLPSRQRIEAQVAFSPASDARSIFRIVSRFRELRLNDTTVTVAADTMAPQRHALTWAPRDSIERHREWTSEPGALTANVHSDDFADVAPDPWRTTGDAMVRLRVQRISDAFRYNRIEGAYTGWGVEARMRDRAPGLTVRGNAGWAWKERVARWNLAAELKRGRWTYTARAGRSLDLTNDFRNPLDSGATIGALFGIDNYDYVDRHALALGAERRFGRDRDTRIRLETGPARDALAIRHVSEGPFASESLFRSNRGVHSGSYWRNRVTFEWHPDVNAEFMRTGAGGALSVEQGTGDLDFVRMEARLTGRRHAGPWTVAIRGDAGLIAGAHPPPQQLFEVGREQVLQGYDYKQFVGTEAVLLRGVALRALPIWRSPIRVGRLVLPGAAPAVALSWQSAWVDLRGEGARRAAADLGELALPVPDSVRRGATEGIRSSVALGLRFLGGSLGVGWSRAVDRRSPWRLRVDFAQVL